MNRFAKTISKFLLLAVIVTQVFGAVFMIVPIKQAEAQLNANFFSPALSAGAGFAASAISVPGNEVFSWHTFLNDLFKQIMLGIGYAFAQYFMQRFVNKLTDKYKIRNFLYYDQILTNYYLSNFIRDKISDPDLRQIYVLLEAGYITGQPTGTTPGTGPNPQLALIPRLKRAIADLYVEQTGVDPNLLQNPPATMTNQEYFSYAQYFYFNNPGYVEQNVKASFGEFQSAATTAAQLEVVVGNGLKAGRFVGGLCEINGRFPQGEGQNTAINTPQGCAANGGVWVASALDQARSFIDNPTAYVDKWMNGLVQELTGSNFDPNNFWFVIGNAFGRFLVNRLLIDRPTGVLNEDPRGYTPSEATLGQGTVANMNAIDLDGDGVGDGYDNDGDGVVDYCVFGGTPPNCVGSRGVVPGGGGGGGGGSGICAGTPMGAQYTDDLRAALDEVIDTNPNGVADLPNTEDGARAFLAEVVTVLEGMGYNASIDVLNGNTNPNTGDLIALWQDGDTMAERYDVVAGAGSGDRLMRDATTTQYVNHVLIPDCTNP